MRSARGTDGERNGCLLLKNKARKKKSKSTSEMMMTEVHEGEEETRKQNQNKGRLRQKLEWRNGIKNDTGYGWTDGWMVDGKMIEKERKKVLNDKQRDEWKRE